LSEELQIPQRTIHTRLRLARDRGLIESPGAGARMGHYE
jgi:DNA-directed RNA polymerase specialized sigma24 family protein